MAVQGDATADKIRKVIFNEITLFLAIIGVVVSGVMSVKGTDAQSHEDIALIRQEISTIKSNDLEHMAAKLLYLDTDVQKQEERLNDIDRKLDRILFILDVE